MAQLNGVEYSGSGWSVPAELWPAAVTRGRGRRWQLKPTEASGERDAVVRRGDAGSGGADTGHVRRPGSGDDTAEEVTPAVN